MCWDRRIPALQTKVHRETSPVPAIPNPLLAEELLYGAVPGTDIVVPGTNLVWAQLFDEPLSSYPVPKSTPPSFGAFQIRVELCRFSIRLKST